MSTIGGLTGSTTSSIRGYGGLASGLDRDTLIEGMTYGTTSKITKQQQKKQQLEWKQAAVQNISKQMIDFANKFTSSWSSKTNLFSSVFWGRNNITTTGKNNKYVSVSGSASSADAISIMGVKQLAQKAKWTSSGQVSDQTLSTGQIDTTKNYDIQNLIGTDIDFKVGNDTAGAAASTYTLTLNLEKKDEEGNVVKTYDYTTPESALEAIKEQMADVNIKFGGSDKNPDGTEKKLSDVVDVSFQDGKFVFKRKSGAGSDALSISGGSALSHLGFKESSYELKSLGEVQSDKELDLVEKVDFDKKIAGKKLAFNYNGKTTEITMPGLEQLQAASTPEQKLEAIKSSMQEQLDTAFGKGRIKVDTQDGKLTLKTMDPSNKDKADTTSTLTLASGNEDVKEALGLRTGASNRLDMSKTLLASGETKKLTINDVDIEVTDKDTMSSLMKKINESKANVNISYQSVADKFTITSKEDGASGTFKISSDDKDFLNRIFGTGKDESGNIKDTIEAEGQDAIVAVRYAGSDEVVELIRDTNAFSLDGLTINVKGKFGYENGKVIDDPDSIVGIDAQVDADSIVDAVKNMVEEYNKIIDLVNKELTTKPDRDYEPLTSEQKKELSEDEIKLYEEKAKQGLLFGDSDLRGLSSDLRFVIGGGIAQELEKIGISTSSTYSDNGKLTFDESKFRAALANDPERVQELFTSSSIQNANGNGTTKGLASMLKDVMDKYVSTMGSWESKGVLVRKAGTESSPLSLTENYMYKQLAEYNKQISKLQTLLETERDRYIKQFTSLETLISQMNSQSNYLSQIGGY